MKKRDSSLDRLRTLAMLWVLGVHVLYWLGVFPTGRPAVVKSFLLLEMPLLFFVSGAGYALSEKRPWGEYALSRLRRILVPYWVYAAVCLLAMLLTGADLAFLGRAALSWLLPLNGQLATLPFLTDAVWFVPVFLVCALALPFLDRLRAHPIPLLAAGWTVFLLCAVLKLGFLRQAVFYSLWMFAGLYYPRLRERLADRKGRQVLCWTALAGLVGMLALGLGAEAVWDMQANKFPPNAMFLCYSLTAMSLLGLLWPPLDRLGQALERWKPLAWAFDRLGRYSLTVFLYQTFAFLAVQPAFQAAGRRGLSGWLVCPLAYLAVFLLCVLLTVPLGPIERLGVRKGK